MTTVPPRLMARRRLISVIALALGLVLSLVGGAPARAAGGTLEGTLTGPGGDRFEYFRIDLYQADGPGTWKLATSRQITSWDTGLPVGDFQIALPAGSYRACFTAMTFESVDDSGRGCWRGAYDVFGATDIEITEGGTTTITPRLPWESQVHGRILGPHDVGISAYVVPYRRAANASWEQLHGSQSLADGSYVLADLDPGTYRFCVLDVPREFVPECWRDVTAVADATELLVRPTADAAVSFRLARRANIGGTITIPAGATSAVGVTAYSFRDARWRAVGYASAGPDGTYRITGLDAGTYRLCAFGHDVVSKCWRDGTEPAAATDIPLTATQTRNAVNLTLSPAGYVGGTLPDVYLGAEGYPSVTAWRSVAGGWEAAAVGDAYPAGGGNNWNYEVGSLTTGTYVVCVEHLEPEFVTAFPRTCNGGSPSPQGAAPFEVVAGATTTGIDIATGQAGEINGSVASPPTRVRVDLYAPTGRLALSQWTGPDGRYRFRELPPGDYRIGFHRNAGLTPLAAEWWQNRGDGLGVAGATPIPVDGDRIIGIRATLDPGGAIDGRLLDSAGAPVAGCTVRARARDNSLAVRTAVTDATGAFSIGGLSTASYVVLVPNTCSGEPSWIYYDTDSADGTTARLRDADDIAVTRGRTTALAVDLHASG